MSEKTSKGKFLKPEKLQNYSNEGKGKEKKIERGEEKKAIVTLLVFIIYFRDKKLFDAKGPTGDNVIKNPARNARSTIFRFTCHFSISLSAQLKHIYALKCNSTQKDSFER